MEKRPRILVVDDDVALAAMYRNVLRMAGYEVATASDGLAALRQLDEDGFDLVVLDLQMPQVRGETVLAELAAHPELQELPVVVVTGLESPVLPVAPERPPVLIHKPVEPERLLSVIEHELDHAA